MKRLVVLAIALVLAACGQESSSPAGPSNTGPLIFAAQLLAANENPPVGGPESSGRGSVTITVTVPRDSAGTPSGPGTVTFSVQSASFAPGSPIILGHIHVGAASVNGPIVVDTGLTPTAPMVLADGTANLIFTGRPILQEVATQMMANPSGYYFNLHSPLNPGGVIRGQLTRVQ
jgi:CHRD domain-containing protein